MLGKAPLARVRVAGALCAALAAVGWPARGWGVDARSCNAAPQRIEGVFVLDTTGSMGGLLQAAKEQIWSIATGLASAKPAPQLRLGIVAFRDRGDTYVTRRFDLTTDLDALYNELMGLEAGGGGDEPESVNQALYEAVTQIDWTSDAHTYRAIFLVGDAPPHMDYADDVKYPRSCQLARERGIAVYAIQCGQISATTPVWNEIAQLGGGTFVRLDQYGAAKEIETPYDKGIATMARQLDGTRLPYGTDPERAASEQRRAHAEHIYDHSSLAAQASRGLFNVTATGRENLYGNKDLLADLQRGATKLDDIDSAELPEALRSLTPAERRTYLENQAKLREDLELTLQSLATKRADYVAKEQAKRADGKGSLTARLLAAMQSQSKPELGSCGPTAP